MRTDELRGDDLVVLLALARHLSNLDEVIGHSELARQVRSPEARALIRETLEALAAWDGVIEQERSLLDALDATWA